MKKAMPATVPRLRTKKTITSHPGRSLVTSSAGCAMPATTTAPRNAPNHATASRGDVDSTANSGPRNAQSTTAEPPTYPPSASWSPNGTAMISAIATTW
jgi:hypothetical protein